MRGDAEVLIVGAGIGGLALAVALHHAGLPVRICERAPELREIGAGLLLTPNGSSVLQRLGALEKVIQSGRVTRTWQICDRRGKVLQNFRAGAPDAPCVSVGRASLHRILCNRLPQDALLLNHEVVAVSEDESGEVRVQCAGGQSFLARLVIGADGGGSVVRRTLAPDAHPRYAGYIGWRALVPLIPERWADRLVSESWGDGKRFGIAPVDASRTYWYASENVPPGLRFTPEERKARLMVTFREWHAPIPELIAATPAAEILLNEICDHPRLRCWQRGKIAVLGDAAHLMTPNMGQGAAMALEDAWALAIVLARHGPSAPALVEYESRRRWRTAWIAWQSRQLGRAIQMESRPLCAIRDLVLRLTPDWLGDAALAPVFRFRA
jgi:2-polyprenyl-6-methoxyphenol hydroxylase-like FAD-dependent oxidoreductase